MRKEGAVWIDGLVGWSLIGGKILTFYFCILYRSVGFGSR